MAATRVAHQAAEAGPAAQDSAGHDDCWLLLPAELGFQLHGALVDRLGIRDIIRAENEAPTFMAKKQRDL